MSKLKAMLMSAAAAALFASGAQANTITLSGSNVGPVFTYTASESGFGTVKAGDFFTIFDFGPASSVVAPAGWTLLTQATGTGIGGTSEGSSGNTQTEYDIVNNDGGATNYTFVWTGADIPGGNVPGPATLLGSFILTSPRLGTDLSDYASRDHDRITGNVQNFNSEQILVPTAVPLPSAAWAGMSLLGLIGAARIRRSMKA